MGPGAGQSNSLVMHLRTVWQVQLSFERGRAAYSTALRMRWPTSMRRSGLIADPALVNAERVGCLFRRVDATRAALTIYKEAARGRADVDRAWGPWRRCMPSAVRSWLQSSCLMKVGVATVVSRRSHWRC